MVRIAIALLSLLVLRPMLAELPISQFRPSGPVAASGPVSTSWNGEAFLVTWTARGAGARAIRIDATGHPLDPTPIGLPTASEDVVWNGDAWIVLGGDGWSRVSREGRLLASQRVALGSPLTAVWTGQRVIAATKTAIVTFDADMTLRDARSMSSDRAPLLAWDGERALLMHDTTGEILDAYGAQLQTRSLAMTDPARPVSIGAVNGGGGFLYIGQTSDSRGEGDWYRAVRVDRDLRTTVIAEPMGRSGFGAPVSDTIPWDGSAFTFAYDSFGINRPWEARVARVSGEGVQLEDQLLLSVAQPSLSWVGAAIDAASGVTLLISLDAMTPIADNCYDCTSALESEDLHIHARLAADAGGLANASPVPLDGGAAMQVAPVAASNATQSLVTWVEGDDHRIFATRVANGVIRDPQSLVISGSACEGTRASIASDGQDFLVAWYDDDGLMSARVAGDGAISEAMKIADMQCSAELTAPVVLSNGSGYLVVWTDDANVLAARVRPIGTLVDPVPLTLGTMQQRTLHGASNGADYLVTWDARFARVAANASVLDPNGRSLGGGSVEAVWPHGASYSLLHMNDDSARWIDRVGTNGSVTRVTDFVTAARTTNDAAACDAHGCSLAIAGESSLRELRAEDDGGTATIQLGDPIAISGEPVEIAPLRGGNGRLFLAYGRRQFEAPAAGALRIFLRSLEPQRSRTVRH